VQPAKESHSENDEDSTKKAIDNFRAEVSFEASAANKSMGRFNESSFQQVPTLMDEQYNNMQINKPMMDNSDIIEEIDSQDLSSSAASPSRASNQEQIVDSLPAMVSRQDAILEAPRRGQMNKKSSAQKGAKTTFGRQDEPHQEQAQRLQSTEFNEGKKFHQKDNFLSTKK
jgi:hypothetical protein